MLIKRACRLDQPRDQDKLRDSLLLPCIIKIIYMAGSSSSSSIIPPVIWNDASIKPEKKEEEEEEMMLHRQSSAPVQPRFEQAGRNQELNSRLQTKADELERLFAEHKRRAHGGGHRREAEESSSENNSESSTASCCSRGELYERYMEKRESRLWLRLRLESEERAATMKALRESLDRATAELKLLQNLRSTTTMSKRDGRDQLVKNKLSEKEEEDEQSDTCSYKSVNSKLLPTKRTMSSSSVGRNSNSSLTRAIPRPSAKATTTGNSARGSGSKNSTSDTRKENTKPSTTMVATSKPSTNFPRSKSSSTGLSSSSSTPSRKLSATPLKPLTLPVARAERPKSAVAAAHDVDVSSPSASTASPSGRRTRKKWASVTGSEASCQPPRKDTGIKRFLQFGRKKKPGAAECSPASGGARDDMEVVVMSKSRLETFSDGAMALEQVQTRRSSMAAASPANCKLKEDHQSPRGVPRSFFSLPPFRNREGDSKLGR